MKSKSSKKAEALKKGDMRLQQILSLIATIDFSLSPKLQIRLNKTEVELSRLIRVVHRRRIVAEKNKTRLTTLRAHLAMLEKELNVKF